MTMSLLDSVACNRSFRYQLSFMMKSNKTQQKLCARLFLNSSCFISTITEEHVSG
jgi:hypothetical protein